MYTYTHTHTHKYAYIHTYAHAHTHKHAHTHTHTHMYNTVGARGAGQNLLAAARKGIKREYRMGTEICRLGGYGFRGTVIMGDGSNQTGGEMGAGCVNLRGKRQRQQRKVGHKWEGSSLNCSKLAAFVLALCGTSVTKPML